ncbi:MAG: tetratricopeptide repeat protein [Bacteroidota bacterium]
MLAKKKKLSKKEIKEDKLVTTFYEAKSFYEGNQNIIYAVVGVIAVIIVAIVLYTNKIESNNMLASIELNRVISNYDSGLYQQAVDGKPGTKDLGLVKIVDEYGGSEQGELARIYLANSYYFLGQYDQAMEAYDEYSGSNDLMIASALAGKANVYSAKAELESAAEFYSKAANVNKFNPSNAEYLLKAGINFLKINDLENAKVSFEKIKNEYQTSLAAREVDRYLAQVKG